MVFTGSEDNDLITLTGVHTPIPQTCFTSYRHQDQPRQSSWSDYDTISASSWLLLVVLSFGDKQSSIFLIVELRKMFYWNPTWKCICCIIELAQLVNQIRKQSWYRCKQLPRRPATTWLHAIVGRSLAALWCYPVNVLTRILDVARFTVDAVLCIDLKALALPILCLDVLIDACRSRRIRIAFDARNIIKIFKKEWKHDCGKRTWMII